LDRQEFAVHGLAPALPFAEDFERHEVLTEDGGDEDTIFFRDELFGDAAFFFDEEGCVAIWKRLVGEWSYLCFFSFWVTYLFHGPCTLS
jgi:hypothetical protein